jgi:molybdate transport system substrate-binding protein
MTRLVALIFCITFAATPRAQTINVAAAISLKEALVEIADQYKTDTGNRVKLTFGSSGQLAAQIAQGAPIDAFISAANKQVDDLVKKKQADQDSRRVIARNELVLIVPASATAVPGGFEDLADPRWKRIAIGEPKTVPAGQYAAQVLESLKIADATRGRLVYGANVRQVLDYATRGEVAAGIVYRTDALEAGDKVKIAAKADPGLHDPIVYPAVVITAGRNQKASRDFLDYLAGPKAQKILEAHRFLPAAEPPARDDKP